MDIRSVFSLDPRIHFLNHGSFGATPRPVMETYRAWQDRLERQPVLFLGREFEALMLQAREPLAAFIGAETEEVVYVPNATYAVNVIARSIKLEPGQEVLGSNQEYGACEYAWQAVCARAGAVYRRAALEPPFSDPQQMEEALWRQVTPQTKVLFLSHIASPTAAQLPVERLCARARAAGILTVIDGAHALGQIPLNLRALGADFYTSNAHKWLCAPKSAAFLYARREMIPLLQALVVSWGAAAQGQDVLANLLQWPGTHDPSAYLSVPAAIAFQREYGWEERRAACKTRLSQTLEQIQALTGLAALSGEACYTQMAAAPLPGWADLTDWKARLYDEFQVEIPLIEWQGHKLARISIQAYNTRADCEALIAGIAHLLKGKP